jgi:hypothetical protein
MEYLVATTTAALSHPHLERPPYCRGVNPKSRTQLHQRPTLTIQIDRRRNFGWCQSQLAQFNTVPLEQGSDGRTMDAEPLSQILDRHLLFILLDQLCDVCHAKAAVALPGLLLSDCGLSRR